ncbi:MAG: DNA cytosine methyltransferase [Sedimentisphaerales bacterium]|nr:DNA cytosine methyltransferase [Sedimentisphaerales bacterium]
MSGNVSERKRLIAITRGNLEHHHIYFTGHQDFFPKECVGASSRKAGVGKSLTLHVEGLEKSVQTDIAGNGKNGSSRNFFRKRSWVRKFFERHEIREGDVLAIERLNTFTYRIYPFESKNVREGAHIPEQWPSVEEGKPTVIDLFAGCGGMSYGLKKAGFSNLLAVEWDASCCETFRQNISPRILQCAIQEVENFPCCDLLIGGPPCQGFSNLGERVPNDPRRQLWRHFLRAVKDANPLIFIMENVPPLLKSAEYEEIVRVARQLGYEVASRILNAADYGVPQQRKRAFLIGSRVGSPVFPDPTYRNPRESPTFENVNLPHWKTVRDAIGDLPCFPTGKNWHIGRNPTELSLQRYRCVPPGGNRFDLPPELTPECWKKKTQGGTDLFGRLWWDQPSVTIRTEFYKPEKGRYLHPEEDRPITHREAARLQGFDDQFVFKGKRIEVGIQIGNAVPPPIAYELGKCVMAVILRNSTSITTRGESLPLT